MGFILNSFRNMFPTFVVFKKHGQTEVCRKIQTQFYLLICSYQEMNQATLNTEEPASVLTRELT